MPKDYGEGYAYACMDELSDGSIGILYEPDEGNLQRIIYDNFSIYEILGRKTTVDLSEQDSYTVSLETQGEITEEPDAGIAEVKAEKTSDGVSLSFIREINRA